MTTAPTQLVPTVAADQLIELTLATCFSPQTRRIYAVQLKAFLASGHPLNREGVALYIQQRRQAGATGSSQASILAAVRKLAHEAQLRGLLSFEELCNIKSIKPSKPYRKAGMWLTVKQVQQLLALPDRTTYWGKRDACLLGLLVGCGLRRAELVALPWTAYQEREGRMCLVDLVGKGDKLRTVPVPLWVQPDMDAWREAILDPSALKGRPPLKSKDETLVAGGLGYEATFDFVRRYGERMGVDLDPHDLRRTLAQMLRRNGAPLEQIQATLGHAKLETTSLYLGSCLELAPGAASVDKLDLHRKLLKRSSEGSAVAIPELDDPRSGGAK